MNCARNIINPEAIDELIHIIAGTYKNLPIRLAHKLLRRLLCNESNLFSVVTERPTNAPSWVTSELISSGTLEQFDRSRWTAGLITHLMKLCRWLNRGYHNINMSARERRKWLSRLSHIATLDQALKLSMKQTLEWSAADSREAKRHLLRMIKDRMSFRDQLKAGFIVERAKLKCGARWFELMRYQSLINEAAEMRSCIDAPVYGVRLFDGHARFFTLRNDDLSPRLSLMVMYDKQIEARGLANMDLTRENWTRVRRFIDAHCPNAWPMPEQVISRKWPKLRQEFILKKIARSSPLAQVLIRLAGEGGITEEGVIKISHPFWRTWRIVEG